MSEDELLRNLGQVAREQADRERLFLDERWDRLAAGTLSAEEDAELLRLADSSDEARAAYEAFRPLGPAFRARVVAAIARNRENEITDRQAKEVHSDESVPRPVVPAPVPLPTVPTPVPRPMPPAPPLPFVRWFKTLGTTTAAMAATWAALIFGAPQIPGLTMAVAGGALATRGDGVETPTWAPGDPFQAVVSPSTAFKHVWPLRARTFLVRDGKVRPVEAHAEVEPSGVVRVTGTLDRDLPTGMWTLWVVVGRWGTLPAAAKVGTLSAHPQKDHHWVAMPQTLNVRPREPG